MVRVLRTRDKTGRRHGTSEAHRLQESLAACTREGVAATVMLGILDYYLIPFALFLGATTGEIGLLVAVPSLLASFSQMFAVRALNTAGSRLSLLKQSIVIQLLLLLPLGFFPFILWNGRVTALIALVAGFRVLGSVVGPSWGSLVSEYLPEHRRGNYFGYRSRLTGVAGVIGLLVWGIALAGLKNYSQAAAFALVFGAAVVFRFVSLVYMSRMIDLPLHQTSGNDFTFWMFIRRFRESNFVKFVLYVTCITFSVQLAVPYFSVYMLKELNFGYFDYTVVNLSSVLAGLVAFPIWGRHADMIGNARVLKVTGLLVPLIPILWMFPRSVGGLAAVEVFGGFVMSGFTLCSTNFIYDAVSPDKRVRCLGYFNLINGLGIFIGASLGGWLAERLPPTRGSSLLTLFLMSSALRFLSNLILARHFEEVRSETRKISNMRLFFSMMGLRPVIAENLEWVFPPNNEAQFRPADGADRRKD